ERHTCAAIERRVALWKELEGEFQVRFCGAAVRVNVAGVERQRRMCGEKPSGFRREYVGVAPDFVNRPAAGAFLTRPALLSFDDARIRHVMEDEASADRT